MFDTICFDKYFVLFRCEWKVTFAMCSGTPILEIKNPNTSTVCTELVKSTQNASDNLEWTSPVNNNKHTSHKQFRIVYLD